MMSPLASGLGSRFGTIPFCLCLLFGFNFVRCEGCLGGRSGEGEGVVLREGHEVKWALGSSVCVT